MLGRPAYVGEGGDGEGPAVGEPVCAAEGVQYNTVQYSTVQYSTVQYSTVRYSIVQ